MVRLSVGRCPGKQTVEIKEVQGGLGGHSPRFEVSGIEQKVEEQVLRGRPGTRKQKRKGFQEEGVIRSC